MSIIPSTAALILAVSAFPINAATTPSNPFAAEVERPTAALVGPGTSGPRVLRAQILLACGRFSPGEIDAQYGEDLAIAIKGFQENHSLKPTGAIDAAMWKLLDAHTAPLLTAYTITAADVKGPFDPLPPKVEEQAKLKWMGYESVEEAVAEKFHMSPRLLAQLNPGKKLVAGEKINVANIRLNPARRAIEVVVSKSRRTVTAIGAGNTVLAQYPATIGGAHDPLPIGDWKIVGIARWPWFYWDPVHFWNVDPDKAPEKLPPGPNNPAGTVWIGLSKPHYGIHGTPDPGHVRHGESYGCIRMTNWDVSDLAQMVIAGTKTTLEE